MSCKIQVALDVVDQERALEIARAVSPWVDILEAGTPLIKAVGLGVVRRLRQEHPDKLILADMKSTDVGGLEAAMAFRAGADITVASGVAPLATSEAVQREAERWGRRCLVDLTGVAGPASKAQELKEIGVDLVLYHRSIDEETTKGVVWSSEVRQEVGKLCQLGIDVGVAGGLDVSTLPLFCDFPVFSLVFGRAITAQPDPATAARELSQRVAELWPD